MSGASLKLRILFLLLFSGPFILLAQQTRTVRGSVVCIEDEKNEPEILPFANLVIINAKDSVVVKHAETDKEGRFSIPFSARKGAKYILKASFLGFKTTFCELPDTASVIRIGEVLLRNTGVVMDEVVVTGKQPEITLKGDTTLIHADAFKVPEGASVKDLVKRVPGLEYDEESGALTYNGKPLRELNVNGEVFFPDNIKTALENLPAKFVSKLKVYDKKTKEEEATGIKSGRENYVLDLQTKKELNNTLLGSVTVGAGNNRKKDLDGNLNYFKKGGENISLFGRSTNRNMNSTYKDNIDNMGGLNLMRRFGEKLTLNGSGMFRMNRSGNVSSSYNEQYRKNGNQYTNAVNEGNQEGKNANLNVGMQWKMNKKMEIRLGGGTGLNENKHVNSSENASFNAPPRLDLIDPFSSFDEVPDSIRVNRNKNVGSSKGHSNFYNFNTHFTYKINEKGTNLNVSLNRSQNNGQNESVSESTTNYFRLKDRHGNDSTLFRNQLQVSPSERDSWNARMSFTQPLSKKIRVQASYQWNVNNESDNRNTYDLSTEEQLRVDSLSSRNWGRTYENRIGAVLNYSDTIWNINANFMVAPQQRSIDRDMGLQHADTTIHSTNLSSNINVYWKRKNKNAGFGYDVNTSQPSLSSLLPLTDNRNPLYITRGNANLKPSVFHNLRLNFDTSKGFSAHVSFNAAQNSITQVTTFDDQSGGRVSWPVNINGNWGMNGSVRGMKKWGKLSVNLDGSGGYNNNVGMVNENNAPQSEKSTTCNTNLQARARVSYQPAWGGLNLTTSYSFNHSLNTLRNNNNYNRNYDFSFDGYVDIPGGVQLRNNIRYLLRSGTNMQKSNTNEINWNAGALWRFLKERKAEVGVYWSDILGQANSYGRSSNSEGFYEYYSMQTRGYIIATFKYNFRIMR